MYEMSDDGIKEVLAALQMIMGDIAKKLYETSGYIDFWRVRLVVEGFSMNTPVEEFISMGDYISAVGDKFPTVYISKKDNNRWEELGFDIPTIITKTRVIRVWINLVMDRLIELGKFCVAVGDPDLYNEMIQEQSK